MKRRADALWPYRDEPCPRRGPALSHVVSGEDPRCTYCATPTKLRPVIETGEDGPVGFTDRQLRTYEFLHLLYVTGRV